MRKGLRGNCVKAGMVLGIMMFLTGCQRDTETMQMSERQEDDVSATVLMEDRENCPLGELFTYLEKKGADMPYAYAKVYITLGNPDEENEGETEEFPKDSDDLYDEYRQDIVRIKGVADISWQTFASAEEFQEYFAAQEQEGQVFSEGGGYEIAFAYYQYQLPEGIHASDMDHFLKERYDKEDNPLYAITLSRRPDQDTYCFSQSNEREIVIIDNIAYGLECKSITDETTEDAVWELLLAYSTQKQKVKTYDGWVMSEETLYWTDHDERITSLENPTRVFTEVKGIDTNWDGTTDMENFSLLKEADYQVKIWEDGPLLQIHFEFAEEIPADGYEIFLCNGFCANKDYEMTVVNADTKELMQSRKVQMSVEIPDMITFADLDGDGYLDMQIDEPTHWNGERAVVDEYSWHTYMVWNAEENGFESKSEDEIAERLTQNQKEETDTEIEAAEYVVVPGDTLWGISRRFYGTGTRYTEIEERNMEVLSDYKYLMPGMELSISD